MENGAAMYQSIKQNKPSQVKEFISLADSLQGGTTAASVGLRFGASAVSPALPYIEGSI